MTAPRRIAITGVGLVTPLGNDAPGTWANLVSGRSAVAPIVHFDAGGFPTRIGAEVKDFHAESLIGDRKLLKFTKRAHRFALAAATEALRDAGIQPEDGTRQRWGFCAGAGMMGFSYEELQTVHAHCMRDGQFNPEGLLDPHFPLDPLTLCRQQSNAGLALITKHFGIEGYATTLHTACASGGQAIGTAMKVIRRGLADFALTGGYDSMLNPLGLSAFCLLGALSTDNDSPQTASRPFDLTRNGFVLGEGAGFLVLEDWSAARKRGARIYAELAGDGNSLNAYRITDSPPSGDGPIESMQRALMDAGLSPSEIDYVNAHGTSTLMNDRTECTALRAVMGRHIDCLSVSSTKSCMGHLIAAAGAVEAAVCALSIRDGIAPVNANHARVDPECGVNLVLGNSRRMHIRAALSNSFGFGGTNSTLAFRHPEEVRNARQQ